MPPHFQEPPPELLSSTAVWRSFEVRGHKIAVVDGRAGRSGPALVFAHGIAVSANLWPAVLQDTRLDDLPWISVGLPAHFPSEAPEGFNRDEVTEEFFAECLATPAREMFGGAPVHLIGWSTGGFAALAVAARHPELAASVVALSGFARGKWRSHLGTWQFLARWRPGQFVLVTAMKIYRRFRWMYRGFVQGLARQKLEMPDAWIDMLFADFGQHDLHALSELIAGIRKLDLTDDLAHIRAPVMLLAGSRDKVIRAAETEHLQEHLPQARLIEIPDAGHIFYGEALAENLDAIEAWIESQTQGD